MKEVTVAFAAMVIWGVSHPKCASRHYVAPTEQANFNLTLK